LKARCKVQPGLLEFAGRRYSGSTAPRCRWQVPCG